MKGLKHLKYGVCVLDKIPRWQGSLNFVPQANLRHLTSWDRLVTQDLLQEGEERAVLLAQHERRSGRRYLQRIAVVVNIAQNALGQRFWLVWEPGNRLPDTIGECVDRLPAN